MTTPSAGLVIGGAYRLEHPLGEGGMGTVWSARAVGADERVAIKLVKGQAPEIARRLVREARLASSIDHPNVVRVHEVLELEDGSPALVMELLEGETLGDRIAREEILGLGEIATVISAAANAVAAAHARGVVHRDLKPANVFLAQTDDTVSVKVLDFGIAKLSGITDAALQTAGLTMSGTLVGTPCYMAPEQASGERDVDERADVWALGMISFQALTGILPTAGENMGQVLKILHTRPIAPLEQVAPEVPADVCSLVNRMLSKEREGRPGLAEVVDVLSTHAGDVRAPPERSRAFSPDAPTIAPVAAAERARTVSVVVLPERRLPRSLLLAIAAVAVALLAAPLALSKPTARATSARSAGLAGWRAEIFASEPVAPAEVAAPSSPPPQANSGLSAGARPPASPSRPRRPGPAVIQPPAESAAAPEPTPRKTVADVLGPQF